MHKSTTHACASGERVMDNVLRILMRGQAGSTASLKAMTALAAQFLTLYHSSVGDEAFASWQAILCATKRLRSVCASAILASPDAEGKNKGTWLTLYSQSDKLAKKLQTKEKSIEEKGLLWVQPEVLTGEELEAARIALEILLKQTMSLESWIFTVASRSVEVE